MGSESSIDEGANAQTKPHTNAEQEGSGTRLETTELFQEKNEDEGKSSRLPLTRCLHAKFRNSMGLSLFPKCEFILKACYRDAQCPA